MSKVVTIKDGEQTIQVTVVDNVDDEKSVKDYALGFAKSEYNASDKAKVVSVEDSDVA